MCSGKDLLKDLAKELSFFPFFYIWTHKFILTYICEPNSGYEIIFKKKKKKHSGERLTFS